MNGNTPRESKDLIEMAKFSEVVKTGGSMFKDGYEVLRATEVMNTNVTIVDVEMKQTQYGDTAFVYLDNGKAFMTTSRILREQLEQIIVEIKAKGITVDVRMEKRASKEGGRSYNTFVDWS